MKILSIKQPDGQEITGMAAAARMAGNLTKAAAAEGVAIASGAPPITEEEAQRRFAICQTCTEYFSPEDERCTHSACGCFLRRKTAWRAQKCPVGKW